MPDLPYNRIISLVPSLTELLFDLGLKSSIIGRTRFCIHPEYEVNEVEIVGGTKNPDIEKIISLAPDLILTNREENRKDDIAALEHHSEIMPTDISSVQEALLEIHNIGTKLGVQATTEKLITGISDLYSKRPDSKALDTAYFIWKDPWMTVGCDTYIHDVMENYDLKNIFGEHKRYPATNLEELSKRAPDLILLSSEPYPFKEKHIAEVRDYCPDSEIKLVNGEWFSWYGSRMKTSFAALNKWRKHL